MNLSMYTIIIIKIWFLVGIRSICCMLKQQDCSVTKESVNQRYYIHFSSDGKNPVPEFVTKTVVLADQHTFDYLKEEKKKFYKMLCFPSQSRYSF